MSVTATRQRASAQWLWIVALGSCALGLASHARADAEPAADGGRAAAAAFDGRDTPSGYCLMRFLAPMRALSSTPPLAAAGEWQDEVAQAASDLRAALRSDTNHEAVVETLIASVPDPIESGLVHQFETSLQALRTGVEHPLASGAVSYFRDRAFLPWDDREVPSAKRAESEACRTALPGLLLFRNSDTRAPRVLAMLLVGEAPTTGMRGIAMLNALRIARVLEGPASLSTNDEARVVRVVGPVFSGSAYSLRLALRHYADEVGGNRHLDYQIVSGTANGADLPNLLRGELTSNSRAEFHSTIPPDADIECVYLWFLRTRLGVDTRELGQSDAAERDTIMPEVATLSELGTEFGAGKTKSPRKLRCPATRDAQGDLRPGVSLAFPIHVSNLRDAYESLDQKSTDTSSDTPIARATSLDAPLTESRVAQDVEADPSSKTRAALDVMLTSTLGEISRRGIRHVGIRATDVGDAIFLARKIRDVAPDVRLAFFDSDDLMLHPEFRSVLLGSLVISAYPFLGVDDLAVHGAKSASVRGFPNALTEGMFNAVLAQRGASKNELLEYAFNDATLPVWISTISRAGLEPTEVRPVRDINGVLYDAAPAANLSAPFYTVLRGTHLPIDPTVPLPRLWVFVVLGLMVLFTIDQTRQSKKADALSDEPMPRKREGSDDRAADRAIARTKWWLYAAIRTFLFVVAFVYLGTIYSWVLVARDFFSLARVWRLSDALHGGCCVLIFGFALAAARRCYQALRQFAHDYARFGRYVGERLFPRSWSDLRAGIVSGRISMHESPPPSAASRSSRPRSQRPPLARWSLSLGLGSPVGRDEAARISFAQLRNIAALACVLTLWFTACLVGAAYTSADWSYSRGANAVPTLTLNVLRSLPLANGISPAAPALLCIACVYAWVVGRMARISLAHQISRISPRDGESDLVSTPIRLILYPNHVAVVSESDEGFTRTERDVLNAIWRPITGRNYVAALLAVTFTPVLLFTIVKPLSTLEAGWGTALLASGLALATSMIGITMIQQIQFWVCLERLLKRMMSHRIGPAFHEIPAFARDSIDEQISRSPSELLRWAGCSRQLDELAATLDALGYSALLTDDGSQLGARATALAECRARALVAADAPEDGVEDPASRSAGPTQKEAAELCEHVIADASYVMRVIEAAWNHRARVEAQRVPVEQVIVAEQLPLQAAGGDAPVAQAVGAVEVAYTPARAAANDAAEVSVKHVLPFGDGEDALAAVTHCFDPGEVQWLRRAQVFVATVVTLLIHRHVRQFRYFATTLTAASLLLLLALTSYPFEPFRLLLTCTWVVVGTVVAAGLWIYVQLHRNTLLSLISGTSPNHVTFDAAFFLRLFAWAGLPLLSVAAAQYPDLANLLFKVISPFVRALH